LGAVVIDEVLSRRFNRLIGAVATRVRRYANSLDQIAACASLRDATVGSGASLNGRVRITGASRLTLGANVHIGDGAFIRAEGGLRIGDNTHISRNVVIYTMNHRYEGQALPYDDGLILKPVTIGRNVWIGMNVCIVGGTTIGDGAIVGMGSVVSGEVPPLAIVGSQPLRELGSRDAATYARLDAARCYGGANGRPLPD
jgi:maltose O-acetyltransferase